MISSLDGATFYSNTELRLEPWSVGDVARWKDGGSPANSAGKW